MRVGAIVLLTALVAGGCGAAQQGTTTVDPAARQQAVDEVTQLSVQHCEHGIHGSLDHVATDGDGVGPGGKGAGMDHRLTRQLAGERLLALK